MHDTAGVGDFHLRDQMRVARKNKEENLDECHQGRLVLDSLPQNIGVGCTVKCNLDCVMCPSRTRTILDMDEAIAAELHDCLRSAREVCWNEAGETFASSKTPYFVGLMNKYRAETSFLSSNFQLVDRWIDDIFKCGMTDILVSIDTVKPEVYERIRRGASWDRLTRNIELFNERKKQLSRKIPRLTFSFVIMKSSLEEMVPFVDFAHRWGAAGVQFLKLLPSPTGIHLTEEPDPKEAYRSYKKALRRARELGFNVVTNAFHMEKALVEIARAEERARRASNSGRRRTPPKKRHTTGPGEDSLQNDENLPIPLAALHQRNADTHILKDNPEDLVIPFCPQPWIEVGVLADGAVRACCFGPKNMGYLNGATFRDIWNGSAYRELRRKILLRDFSICGDCIYLKRKIEAEKVSDSFRTLNMLIRDLESRGSLYAVELDGEDSLFVQVVEILKIVRLNVERIDRCKENIGILLEARNAVTTEIEKAAAQSRRPRTIGEEAFPESWNPECFEAFWARLEPGQFGGDLLGANLHEKPVSDVFADLLKHEPFAVSSAIVSDALAVADHEMERSGLSPNQRRVIHQALAILQFSAECVESNSQRIEQLVKFVCTCKREIAYLNYSKRLLHCESNVRSLDRTLWELFYSAQVLYHNTPNRIRAGDSVKVDLLLANTSAVPWPTRGMRAVCVAYRWKDGDYRLYEAEGPRTALPGPFLRPFWPVAVRAILNAPKDPGRYVLEWSLVYEFVAWFQDKYWQPLEVEVEVLADSADISSTSTIRSKGNIKRTSNKMMIHDT